MQNADAQELAKFAARADEWWDPRGAFRTLHEINELRLDYIAERASLVGARALQRAVRRRSRRRALARRRAKRVPRCSRDAAR